MNDPAMLDEKLKTISIDGKIEPGIPQIDTKRNAITQFQYFFSGPLSPQIKLSIIFLNPKHGSG